MVITKAEAGYPIIYVNSGYGELTGYGPYEVIGKSPSMLQGPNTDRAVTERLENDISKGRLLHGQAIEYWKDGSEFMMEWEVFQIRIRKGRPKPS